MAEASLEECLRPAAASTHMAVSGQGMAMLRWYWFTSMGPSWERLRPMLRFLSFLDLSVMKSNLCLWLIKHQKLSVSVSL